MTNFTLTNGWNPYMLLQHAREQHICSSCKNAHIAFILFSQQQSRHCREGLLLTDMMPDQMQDWPTRSGQSDCTCVSGHSISCTTVCSSVELPKQVEQLELSVAKPELWAAKPELSAAKPELPFGVPGSKSTDSVTIAGASDNCAAKTVPFLPA